MCIRDSIQAGLAVDIDQHLLVILALAGAFVAIGFIQALGGHHHLFGGAGNGQQRAELVLGLLRRCLLYTSRCV